MPTTPIIIPIVVAGVTLGSLLASQTRKISKKKLLTVSLVSGILNGANAFLVYTLFPPTTSFRSSFSQGTSQTSFTFTGSTTFAGGGGFRATGGGMTAFVLTSFITGFLIVLAVVAVALYYARFKGGKSEDESEFERDHSEEARLDET
jgi:hypothetical protein